MLANLACGRIVSTLGKEKEVLQWDNIITWQIQPPVVVQQSTREKLLNDRKKEQGSLSPQRSVSPLQRRHARRLKKRDQKFALDGDSPDRFEGTKGAEAGKNGTTPGSLKGDNGRSEASKIAVYGPPHQKVLLTIEDVQRGDDEKAKARRERQNRIRKARQQSPPKSQPRARSSRPLRLSIEDAREHEESKARHERQGRILTPKQKLPTESQSRNHLSRHLLPIDNGAESAIDSRTKQSPARRNSVARNRNDQSSLHVRRELALAGEDKSGEMDITESSSTQDWMNEAQGEVERTSIGAIQRSESLPQGHVRVLLKWG
jgi:hypothetical protein